MGKLFRYLDYLETGGLGLDHAVLPLAVRQQFESAGRRSEIVTLQWDWGDLEHWRVVWPDSKTGGMSKPLSEEAYRLLSTAPCQDGCPSVCVPVTEPSGVAQDRGDVYALRLRRGQTGARGGRAGGEPAAGDHGSPR